MLPETGPGGAPPRWTPLRGAALAAGAAVLAVLLARIGPGVLVRSLQAIGWRFLLVLSLGGAAASLNTLSWSLATAPARRVPFEALFRMLLAGEAVNALAPVGVVGGELVRYAALRRWIPAADALASVLLAATAQFAGQVLFVLSGLPVALTLLELPGWRSGVLAASAAAGLLLALVLCLAWSPRALDAVARSFTRFAWMARLHGRLPPAVRQTLEAAAGAMRRSPADFARSVAAALAAWQIGVVETLLVLRLLGRPARVAQALAIEVLAVAIEGILFFVPARLGALEGGRVAACVAVGLDPAAGLTLGVVRRARDLLWAVPGLVLIGAVRPRVRVEPPPVPGVIRGGPPLPG